MSEQPQAAPGMRKEAGRQFWVALLAGFVIVVIAGVAVYFMTRGSGETPGAPPPLPMGAAEQAYTQQIHFGNFSLTRATNMLKMEITNVDGVIENAGARTVEEVEVALEFEDLSHNVIFRDTRRILGGAPALAAGEKRPFRLSFDAIPAGWNQVPPKFTITGLQLK
jgi:hypothetical protein